MKTSTKIAILLLVVLLIGVASAVYIMQAPMSSDVVVTGQATLSKVSVSSILITAGDSLTLSTTVSDHTQGITVTFFNQNDVSVGTAVTGPTGTATLTIQPPVGTWSFYATATHP
jgi:hypothetical protein